MKKLALLFGTLGGTAAWYFLSSSKLRRELAKAKSPDETAEVLMRHLGRDAKKIAKEVHDLVRSEEVQEGLSKAKEFTEEKLSIAKDFTEDSFSVAKDFTEEKFKVAKKGFFSLWEKGKKAKDAAIKEVKKRRAS